MSQNQLWLAFMLAMGFHVLPLVLADFLYLDDIWRSMLAGKINGQAVSWAEQGRVLVDWLYSGLGGVAAAPDLFPLPLLLSVVVVARAFASLTATYFERPGLADTLVVLPLWFSPFFLQNLSYQYDGPAMGLSLAVCVWAITIGVSDFWRCLIGGLLITAALSLYQPAVNVFAILCCIEILRQADKGAAFRSVARHLALRLAQLVAGCLIYRLTAYRLITVPRTALLPIDAHWPGEILARMELVVQDLALLVTPGNALLAIGILLLAVVGLTLVLQQVQAGPDRLLEKCGLGLLVLLSLPISFILIPGLALLLAYFDHGARLLMGCGAAMVLLAFLARRALITMHPRLGWVLLLPLVLMLSMSFAYGRVLVAQKELHRAFVQSLATTIETHPALQGVDRIYFYDWDSKGLWLPAASGTLKAMPALRKILNIRFWTLTETMPRVGLMNVVGAPKSMVERATALDAQPLIDTRFFAIYRVDNAVLLIMKVPSESEVPNPW
ncbi:glucosyltransferase domain-containing protein [Pseudomonas carassii]|uniref:Glucosyltransferase domain-containing protein n=1 Tax=Pseudomonas carassii TaxID=3115855 RepID=A0ABU7HFH2_9PSED|nr:glucosyltransferase domain-containing protein [Pseudomonas sp. 137P]MEE1889712.1 glucosyltransferase domain-containing protein [Pseudomonas sp. 137P]